MRVLVLLIAASVAGCALQSTRPSRVPQNMQIVNLDRNTTTCPDTRPWANSTREAWWLCGKPHFESKK